MNFEILNITETSEPTVSHKVLAEKTDNNPQNLLNLIDKYTPELSKFGLIFFKKMRSNSSGYERGSREAFLNEYQSTLLITFMRNSSPVVKFKVKLVQEYATYHSQQKIEQQPLALTNGQIALADTKALKELYSLFDVPEHYAIQEIASEVTRQSGIDVTKALTQAPAMNNIPQSDVMLEPSELGKLFDLSGAEMNLKLEGMSLQKHIGKEWVPTEKGKSIGSKHGWSTKFKSGYNLKWKVEAIKELLEMNNESSS